MDKQEKLVEALLRGALAIISKPSTWTRRQLAYSTQTGYEVDPLDERANKWCAVGAITLTAHRMGLDASTCGPEGLPNDGSPYVQALSRLCEIAHTERFGWSPSVEAVNDNRGRAAVVELFKVALSEAEPGDEE